MEGVQQVKMDFPLVKTISRDKLIDWFRERTSPKLHTIKELGTGADFCLGLETLFPGCIGKHKIKFDNPSVYDRRQNFMLLQSAFNSLKLNKDVPIEQLEEGNYRETYYFALWFKAFFETNYKGTTNHLKWQCPVKNDVRNATAGGFRQTTDSCQQKDTEVEGTIELQIDPNIEKDSSETKSSLQRKRKRPVIASKIINPRMPTFSRMEQETPKLNKCDKTLEQREINVLTQQTEELERAVKDLAERKKVFDEDKVDFEKRIGNLGQLKMNQDPELNETNDPPNLPETVKVFEDVEDTKEENEDVAKRTEEKGLKEIDLEKQLEQIHQVGREQRRIIEELEQQKESKGEQITTFERIVYELTQAIQELETVKQNQAEQIKELEEMTAMQQKTEDLEQIMNEQLKVLEDLSQTKEDQIKKIEELEQTNTGLVLNNAVLTKNNKAMTVHIDDLELSYKELTKQNDNLTKCNKELACHFSDLSNENRELNQRNKRLAKNYETILCYSCLDANLYFKQLVKIEKACKTEPTNALRKCINAILNQTKYHPPLAPGSGKARRTQAIAHVK